MRSLSRARKNSRSPGARRSRIDHRPVRRLSFGVTRQDHAASEERVLRQSRAVDAGAGDAAPQIRRAGEFAPGPLCRRLPAGPFDRCGLHVDRTRQDLRAFAVGQLHPAVSLEHQARPMRRPDRHAAARAQQGALRPRGGREPRLHLAERQRHHVSLGQPAFVVVEQRANVQHVVVRRRELRRPRRARAARPARCAGTGSPAAARPRPSPAVRSYRIQLRGCTPGIASRRGWCRPGRRRCRTTRTDSPPTRAPHGRTRGRSSHRVRCSAGANPWSPSPGDRVPLDLGDQGRARDAEFERGVRAIAAVMLERAIDVHPLQFLERQRRVAAIERREPRREIRPAGVPRRSVRCRATATTRVRARCGARARCPATNA